MDGLHIAGGMDMTVEDGDIAKAGYPFWFMEEVGEIKPVNDPNSAIPAPGCDNCFNGLVVEKALKVFRSKLIVAGKLMMDGGNGIAQDYLKSPGLQ